MLVRRGLPADRRGVLGFGAALVGRELRGARPAQVSRELLAGCLSGDVRRQVRAHEGGEIGVTPGPIAGLSIECAGDSNSPVHQLVVAAEATIFASLPIAVGGDLAGASRQDGLALRRVVVQDRRDGRSDDVGVVASPRGGVPRDQVTGLGGRHLDAAEHVSHRRVERGAAPAHDPVSQDDDCAGLGGHDLILSDGGGRDGRD